MDEIPPIFQKQHGSDLHEVDINGKVIPHHPRFHLGGGTQMKEVCHQNLGPFAKGHAKITVLRELGAQNPQQTLAGVGTNSTAQVCFSMIFQDNDHHEYHD